MLAPYRKIEMLELLMFSFRIVQNFRPNSRPLNSGLEKNALHIWIQNDLSFSKLFEIWKSDELWQMNNPNNLMMQIIFFSDQTIVYLHISKFSTYLLRERMRVQTLIMTGRCCKISCLIIDKILLRKSNDGWGRF